MKAMILVDMPDDAKLDEWYAVTVVVDRLIATEEELMQGIPFDESKVFKFVPLKPLPQKMTMEKALKMERVGAICDIYTTWDACLREITGEIG